MKLNNTILKYFSLTETPFAVEPDPRFLTFADTHYRQVAHQLFFNVYEGVTITLLTGPLGSGKTLLLQWLKRKLDDQALIISKPEVGEDFTEFLGSLYELMGIQDSGDNRWQKLAAIESHLQQRFSRSQRPLVLLIDNGETLSEAIIYNLALLTDLKQGGKPLLVMVIAADETAEERLVSSPLRQSIKKSYRLRPLAQDSIAYYVHHRLGVAGAQERDLFSAEGVERITVLSRGIPRLINELCECSLQQALLHEKRQVSAALVDEASRELGLSAESNPHVIPAARFSTFPAGSKPRGISLGNVASDTRNNDSPRPVKESASISVFIKSKKPESKLQRIEPELLNLDSDGEGQGDGQGVVESASETVVYRRHPAELLEFPVGEKRQGQSREVNTHAQFDPNATESAVLSSQHDTQQLPELQPSLADSETESRTWKIIIALIMALVFVGVFTFFSYSNGSFSVADLVGLVDRFKIPAPQLAQSESEEMPGHLSDTGNGSPSLDSAPGKSTPADTASVQEPETSSSGRDSVMEVEPQSPKTVAPDPDNSTSTQVARSQLTNGIKELEPIDHVGPVVYTQGNERSLYYFTEIKNMRGKTVSHIWQYKGEAIAEVTFQIGGDRWRVYSRKTLLPFMTGPWKVLVVDSQGTVLQHTSFTYQKRP